MRFISFLICPILIKTDKNMFMDKALIGQKIKEHRKKKKLSQSKLAEIVGLSDKHIGRIESGLYFPGFMNFIKIMEVLELNFSDIGVNLPHFSGSDTEELLKLVYSSSEEEIKLFLRIIKAIKNI